ncbi:hypothetical protein cypCar_00031555 [Cyprinus carpio]|nr:hypothetical protein cypCar_00031555 [Cyprinus carpio]
MEYCAQGQLYEVLRAGRKITPSLLVDWAMGIAGGMNYLHLHKIIHRDLKSPNMLITHDDLVKISDFGTSKELRDKSTKMSFAGTVAWMAPEVIRNEPVSEKVDIWSFGVVLWEMLTGEIPYKDVDSSAIIWGVGNNSLQLPLPESCPDGFKILLRQCWNCKPRNRPSFRQILLHLDIASADVLSTPQETYFRSQAEWREEVKQHFEKIKSEGTCLHRLDEELINRRREELRHALDIREHYERKLERANNLYMELNAVMLQLELKEKELLRREQCLDKKYPGLFKHHPSTTVDKLIKKRSVPQKLPPHGKRPDLLRSEIILPKMDAGVLQVTVPPCANRGPTSPSRARRVKTRHRRSGRGSSGDLSGPKHPSALASREKESPLPNTTPPPPPLTETASGAAMREAQLEPPPLKLSSSSPDLLSSTHHVEDGVSGAATTEALGREPGGGAEAGAGLDETPPRSDTASEDAASLPFSSSPDSPCCGRSGAVGRTHVGEEREEGTGTVRLPRGSSGSHLTPSAILYRAAITRKQDLFRFGLSEPIKSMLPGEEFICSLRYIMDYALSLCGSPFTVGEAEDFKAPKSLHKMAPSPEAVHKVAAAPETPPAMAASPAPLHTDRPSPAHARATPAACTMAPARQLTNGAASARYQDGRQSSATHKMAQRSATAQDGHQPRATAQDGSHS